MYQVKTLSKRRTSKIFCVDCVKGLLVTFLWKSEKQ
jgi:hypothetical protein